MVASDGSSHSLCVAYWSARCFPAVFALALSLPNTSFCLGLARSALRYRRQNLFLQMNLGALKIRRSHSGYDFMLLTDCMLNQRNTVAPMPCLFSRDFLMSNAKLCSIALTKAPWPDSVMYLAMYYTTAPFEGFAWMCLVCSAASKTSGTKLRR